MAISDSRLITKREGDVYHVGFTDRNLLEEINIQAIGVEIRQLVEATDHPKILINFENVEHLSSAALGVLITINNRIKEKGGQLRLSNITPPMYEIFQITKLNKLFQIHDNVEQAIKSFK